MSLALGFGLGAPWRGVRVASGAPDPSAALFVLGPGQHQTWSMGRLARWDDMLGGGWGAVPYSGPLAGPQVTDSAGRAGFQVQALQSDVALVQGDPGASWPAAWSANVPGPVGEGITVYALVRLDVPPATFPDAYRQAFVAGTTNSYMARVQLNGPGPVVLSPVGDNYLTGTEPSGPALIQGQTTLVAMRMSRGSPEFALKVGGAPWSAGTAVRGQVSGPLLITLGGPGLVIGPGFAGRVSIFGAAAWAAAHDDATAEAVRAYLESIGI